MRGLLVLGCAALLGGCNDPTYLRENRPLETTPATMMGQQGYQSDTDLFVLPVRRPSQIERRAMMQEQMRLGLTMPVPWVGERDFDIEVEYALKNLDKTATQAFVTLDGGNEFGDYVPASYIDPNANADDQANPPDLLGGSPISLGPNEIKTGVFREDELVEAGIDLEAITRYPDTDVRATPFEVIEHNSTASNVGLTNVPKNDVTPAMVRLRFTLSAGTHVVMDYSVRVRDHSGKLASPTASNLYVPTDATLAPPVMPPPLTTP